MNADDFRHLYDYHFSQNRKLWDMVIVPLSDDLFAHPIDYSVGSIRNQCVHVAAVDNRWFSGLRGLTEIPDVPNPILYPDKARVRAFWDEVESHQRAYLPTMTDETLNQELQPGLKKWQVLYQVLNHGTDHRAQMHSILNGLGVATQPQDYFFFATGRDI